MFIRFLRHDTSNISALIMTKTPAARRTLVYIAISVIVPQLVRNLLLYNPYDTFHI